MRGYPVEEMIDKVFGKLTVMGKHHKKLGIHIAWNCVCECGISRIVRGDLLRKGHTKTCGNTGCRKTAVSAEEMLGKVFGKLTVVGEHNKRIGSQVAWDCICVCGRSKTVRSFLLRRGKTKTCGSTGCRSTPLARNKPLGHFKNNLRDLVKRAKRKGWKVEIDLEHLWQLWMDQATKCAVTGYPMTTVKGRGRVDTNVSIDRIDSDRGYEIGNVQLVCAHVNVMKSNLKTARFEWWCRLVAANNPSSDRLIPGTNVIFEVQKGYSQFTTQGHRQLTDSTAAVLADSSLRRK